MIIERLSLGSFQANCYIVGPEASGEAIIIDPGDEPQTILQAARDLKLTPRLIIATHGHIDHILAAQALCEATGAPFAMHQADRPLLEGLPDIARRWLGVAATPPTVDRWLEAGDSIGIDGLQLRVLYTPGHSWGSISLYWTPPPGEAGIVFSGDALFAGGIGRTDLGGDFPTLARSIREQLFTLPADTVVLSGHGGPTTIGHERRTNPWVGELAHPFQEP